MGIKGAFLKTTGVGTRAWEIFSKYERRSKKGRPKESFQRRGGVPVSLLPGVLSVPVDLGQLGDGNVGARVPLAGFCGQELSPVVQAVFDCTLIAVALVGLPVEDGQEVYPDQSLVLRLEVGATHRTVFPGDQLSVFADEELGVDEVQGDGHLGAIDVNVPMDDPGGDRFTGFVAGDVCFHLELQGSGESRKPLGIPDPVDGGEGGLGTVFEVVVEMTCAIAKVDSWVVVDAEVVVEGMRVGGVCRGEGHWVFQW